MVCFSYKSIFPFGIFEQKKRHSLNKAWSDPIIPFRNSSWKDRKFKSVYFGHLDFIFRLRRVRN